MNINQAIDRLAASDDWQNESEAAHVIMAFIIKRDNIDITQVTINELHEILNKQTELLVVDNILNSLCTKGLADRLIDENGEASYILTNDGKNVYEAMHRKDKDK